MNRKITDQERWAMIHFCSNSLFSPAYRDEDDLIKLDRGELLYVYTRNLEDFIESTLRLHKKETTLKGSIEGHEKWMKTLEDPRLKEMLMEYLALHLHYMFLARNFRDSE